MMQALEVVLNRIEETHTNENGSTKSKTQGTPLVLLKMVSQAQKFTRRFGDHIEKISYTSIDNVLYILSKFTCKIFRHDSVSRIVIYNAHH